MNDWIGTEAFQVSAKQKELSKAEVEALHELFDMSCSSCVAVAGRLGKEGKAVATELYDNLEKLGVLQAKVVVGANGEIVRINQSMVTTAMAGNAKEMTRGRLQEILFSEGPLDAVGQ